MSRKNHKALEVMGRCKFCNQLVYYRDVHNEWQRVHTSCAVSHPTDFIYTRENFTLELRSTLMSPNFMRKIFKSI